MSGNYFLLALSLIFAACTKNVDYAYSTTFCIQNNSSYDIEIRTEQPLLIPKVIQIGKGKTYSLSKDSEGAYIDIMPFLQSHCTANFDDNAMTTYRNIDGDKYHNFCSKSAYVRNEIKPRAEVFTFTFTNADYEYAISHTVQ